DKPFVINKYLIRKDFYIKNKQNRNNFFKKYIETEQNIIRTVWYEYVTKIKDHIMFFNYLPIYINQQENKHIFMNKKSTTTCITTDNKVIKTIHPPSEKIQINIPNGKIQAVPFKLQTENTDTLETNKIIEQNNYTNKHLQTIGSQLQLTLNEVNQILQSLIIPETPSPSTPQKEPKNKMQINVIQEEDETSSNDSTKEITNQLSAVKTRPLTPYYHIPTYSDLQIEERGKFVQASCQSGTIYEWNLDCMNEYHIINKLQEMTMISNAYKIKNAFDKVVTNILITGFTGQLKGLWDNVLTVQQQTDILESIQTEEIGEPILNIDNEPTEDVIATLIYNITKYFIGD
ncbi:LOW QUALITY PROTEIN: hypothetical protein CFOL_v3_01591, partial [Cephalotus follicularis]